MYNAYCTVDDILSVAFLYAKDVVPEDPGSEEFTTYEPNTRTIPRQSVEDIADEATQYVRNIIAPHYDLVIIDEYYPAFPPMIVSFTKTIGAIMMYERYAVLAPENVEKYTKPLQIWIDKYLLIINGVNLRDVNGARVPSNAGAGTQMNTSSSFNALNNVKRFPAAALVGEIGA